ncbi:MAG: hypothetical protein M3R38_17000 [Actinomycetota bacterium]|nr:hypothetical protein [Actinomycetota bacterium]
MLPVEPETVEFVETTIEENVEGENVEEVPRSVTTGSGSAPVQTLLGRLRGFLGRG